MNSKYVRTLFVLVLIFSELVMAAPPRRKLATDGSESSAAGNSNFTPSSGPGSYSPTPSTTPNVALTSIRPAPVVDEFNGIKQAYWFGYEGPSVPTTSIFQESAVNFGMWFNRVWGLDLYFGYGKIADTYTSTTVTNTDLIANTSTVATTSTGATFARTLMFGGAIKYRVYQTRFFGVSADFMLTFTPGTSTSYQAGSHTVTTPAGGNPQTVSDVGYGTVTSNTSPFFRVGPRINADYNLPFLPNLVLGFSAGLFMSLGGQVNNSSSLLTQTYQVVSGVPQTPTVNRTVVNGSSTDPGGTSNTYGLGGTGLQIGNAGFNPIAVVGTFRIRYAF